MEEVTSQYRAYLAASLFIELEDALFLLGVHTRVVR